jgi:hypothetical protein
MIRVASGNLLIVVLVISGRLHADALCENFARAACAPGHLTDPTGSSKSAAEIEAQNRALENKAEASARSKFSSVLDDPANEYFRKLARAAYGFNEIGPCAKSAASNDAECTRELADQLSRLTRKTLFPLSNSGAFEGDLQDLGYVSQDSNYVTVATAVADEIKRDINVMSARDKVTKIFPQIRDALVERVAHWPFDDDTKQMMLSKLKAIRFAGTSCDLISDGADTSFGVSPLLEPNAYYEPSANNFRFCAGLSTRTDSAFGIAMTIAHELSHSLDPCRLAAGPTGAALKYSQPNNMRKSQNEHPFAQVLRCLRDFRSAGARRMVWSPPEYGQLNANGVQYPNTSPNGLGHPPIPPSMPIGAPIPLPTQPPTSQVPIQPTLPGRQVAPANGPVPMGMGGLDAPNFDPKHVALCDRDELTEAFADWLGIETLASYSDKTNHFDQAQFRNGYANAWRTVCQVSGGMDVAAPADDKTPHPTMEKRINFLFMANPTVRRHMGCPPIDARIKYCSMDVRVDPPVESPAGPATISR